MCPYSCLFCIRHIFASLITNQKGNFSISNICFFTWNSHPFHIKIHADLWFLLYHLQDHFLYTIYLLQCLVFLILNIHMEVINKHRTDSLAIECFDSFYLLTNSLWLYYRLFDLNITKQSMVCELFASLLEDSHTCMFLPYLIILFTCVKPKIIYLIESIKNSLLLKELLEFHELGLSIMIFGQSSLWNNHILFRILLLELNYLPIIRIIPFLHITKLLRHFPINSW